MSFDFGSQFNHPPQETDTNMVERKSSSDMSLDPEVNNNKPSVLEEEGEKKKGGGGYKYKDNSKKIDVEKKQEINQNDEAFLDDPEGEIYNIFYPFDFKTEDMKNEKNIIEMDSKTLQRMKDTIWGKEAETKDIDRWYQQGFGFVPHEEMGFGLLQLHGGPCGILASVQGFVLRELLFDPLLKVQLKNESDTPVIVTDQQKTEALTRSLHKILLKCAIDKHNLPWIVALDNKGSKVWYRVHETPEKLRQQVEESMPLLQSAVGVVAFLFSIVMARSFDILLSEVDDPNNLWSCHIYALKNTTHVMTNVHRFGHCSQELVNLVLSGRAVSNTHDGDKAFGSNESMSQADIGNAKDLFILKGIGPNQEIGFLTSLEVMGYTKVGEHYKTPKYPIWVIGSSSHYSVVFALDENVGKISVEDAEQVSVRRAFTIYDQLEHGFIQFRDLNLLLSDLGIKLDFDLSDCRVLLDPDNTQVIVWVQFWKFFQQLKHPEKLKWECKQCTFQNPLNKKNCEVCDDLKGSQPIILFDEDTAKETNKSKSETKAPKNFTMYHFNGLRQTKKDRPLLTKLRVFDEADIEAPPPGIAEELTGLIRTKWPYAIVEYSGPFAPKVD
ncbi:hypothetical protein RFI_07117 [Reticulomyxa filosa]|uniref:ubiquitinyl hydrolase 1 n=1 Tax=Reticulomyxa filosa TaxID=46433 RepID=X6NW03_RETFI|nr:hypothetical protein RFI_07117 [Reticulomyxa filosa]|eukprot:ETO30004.1 hypothetical protein RFI_07117 [Reticulomyxa filosa]